MTLGFTTQLGNEPSYFVEKIHAGIENCHPEVIGYQLEYYKRFGLPEFTSFDFQPKIHTIRQDMFGKWQPGRLIHFVVGNRAKDRFQFAPVIPCVVTQSIRIKWTKDFLQIFIDGQPYAEIDKSRSYPDNNAMFGKITALAINDGFPDVWAFLAYFKEDFSGKIIHWTPFKYE